MDLVVNRSCSGLKTVRRRMVESLIETFRSREQPRHPQHGQALVEYALIIALIAIALVAGSTAYGVGLQEFYGAIRDSLMSLFS